MKRELLPRYNIDAFVDGSDVCAETCEYPIKDGDWVKWSDVSKLLFDDELNSEVQNLRVENARLRGIMRRLEEAISEDKLLQKLKV